jgi:hypothetical protein
VLRNSPWSRTSLTGKLCQERARRCWSDPPTVIQPSVAKLGAGVAGTAGLPARSAVGPAPRAAEQPRGRVRWRPHGQRIRWLNAVQATEISQAALRAGRSELQRILCPRREPQVSEPEATASELSAHFRAHRLRLSAGLTPPLPNRSRRLDHLEIGAEVQEMRVASPPIFFRPTAHAVNARPSSNILLRRSAKRSNGAPSMISWSTLIFK